QALRFPKKLKEFRADNSTGLPSGMESAPWRRRPLSGDVRWGISVEDMGEQQVKNFARPVRACSIPIAGKAMNKALLPLPDKPSLAGLPFPEHDRRPRAGLFRRRHCRRDHDGNFAPAMAVRDRP